MKKYSDQSLDATIVELRQQLAVDVCSLYLTEREDSLVLAASSGLNNQAVGTKLHYTQGLTGKVASSRKSLSVKNPHTHPDYFHVSGSGEDQYKSYLGIPLVRRQMVYGVLVVQTIKPKLFMMSEIQTLFAAGRTLMEQLDVTAMAS